MSKKHNVHHLKQPPVKAMPQNIAAQLTITAFTDGRPPAVSCNVPPLDALTLLSVALQAISNELRKGTMPTGQADPVDKPREYLGPRKYGEERELETQDAGVAQRQSAILPG